MNKIKEKFYNLIRIFKMAFETFPITMIAIFIITTIQAISIDNDIMKYTTLSNILLFLLIFACGTFLIETVSKPEKKKRIGLYILSALLALLLTYSVNIECSVIGIDNAIFLNRIERLIVCYIISTLVITVYYLYKKSSKTFESYVTNVANNILKETIIYGILAIGIAIIMAVFNFLIIDINKFSIIARVEILLLGFYYIPRILYSFYNTEREISKFIKIVIKYVLDVLVIVAFAIIYLYIAKILILRDMPSNQIYRIVAALFIIGCPIWTMTSYFNENNAIDKINRKLPILFTPFIVLQIYTIGVRIINNGFTEARYLCVMLIIFEIIYTIIYVKNAKEVGKSLLVFVGIVIVSTIVPYINMYKVSQISQYNNLKIYKEKESLTQEEKDKISGAYYYLRSSNEGKKLINRLLTEENIENIISYKKINETIEYIYGTADLKNINVEGYKNLYTINSYSYSSTYSKVEEVFKKVKIDLEESKEIIYLDLSNTIKNCILNKENIDDYLKNHNEIIIDSNKKLIIKNLSFRYNEGSKTVSAYYSIHGYLLEK